MSDSIAQLLASLPEAQREEILASITPELADTMLHDWRFWARPEQLPPPGDWRVWLILTGRGWGKSRTGAEWVRAQVAANAARRIALVAPTAADARDVMVEGESGILSIGPERERPQYEPSKRRLTWPNGAIATLFSADEPERLRGPQHDAAWCDELAAWRYMQEAWDMLLLGLRLGSNPKAVVTTTPKPRALLKALINDPHTHVTRGTTFDNLPNLAPQFAEQIIQRYHGTRIGRQELNGEILDDVEGALWQRAWIDEYRCEAPPHLQRVVVAVDPAATSGPDSDETGIIVAGVGVDARWYVLADRSCRLSPDGWARRAVEAFHEFAADRIVGEINNGGDMVEHVIRTIDRTAPYKAVHASRGKIVRAEPIAALYEQGRVSHVGEFQDLEDQLCSYTGHAGEQSPDRMDALVWALTELHSTQEPQVYQL